MIAHNPPPLWGIPRSMPFASAIEAIRAAYSVGELTRDEALDLYQRYRDKALQTLGQVQVEETRIGRR